MLKSAKIPKRCSIWWARLDSNQRLAGDDPAALADRNSSVSIFVEKLVAHAPCDILQVLESSIIIACLSTIVRKGFSLRII